MAAFITLIRCSEWCVCVCVTLDRQKYAITKQPANECTSYGAYVGVSMCCKCSVLLMVTVTRCDTDTLCFAYTTKRYETLTTTFSRRFSRPFRENGMLRRLKFQSIFGFGLLAISAHFV